MRAPAFRPVGGAQGAVAAIRLSEGRYLTVKFHVESLFRKLGARTRTEAVAKAAERQVDV